MRFASRVLAVGEGWIELERPLLYGKCSRRVLCIYMKCLILCADLTPSQSLPSCMAAADMRIEWQVWTGYWDYVLCRVLDLSC